MSSTRWSLRRPRTSRSTSCHRPWLSRNSVVAELEVGPRTIGGYIGEELADAVQTLGLVRELGRSDLDPALVSECHVPPSDIAVSLEQILGEGPDHPAWWWDSSLICNDPELARDRVLDPNAISTL